MAVHAAYFNRDDEREPNPGLKSPPSTRPMSALPLVTSILHLGLRQLRERLAKPLQEILKLHRYCQELPGIEVCHTPDTGILCFRFLPDQNPLSSGETDDLQRSIHASIQSAGERSISITSLNGRPVLRLLATSPVVTSEALKESVGDILQVGSEHIKHKQ